jgi:hypothetical protein
MNFINCIILTQTNAQDNNMEQRIFFEPITQINYFISFNDETDVLSILAIQSTLENYNKWQIVIDTPLITKDKEQLLQVSYPPKKLYEKLFEIKNYELKSFEQGFLVDFPTNISEDGSLVIKITTSIPNLNDTYSDVKVIILNFVETTLEESLTTKFNLLRKTVQDGHKCEQCLEYKKALDKVNVDYFKVIAQLNEITDQFSKQESFFEDYEGALNNLEGGDCSCTGLISRIMKLETGISESNKTIEESNKTVEESNKIVKNYLSNNYDQYLLLRVIKLETDIREYKKTVEELITHRVDFSNNVEQFIETQKNDYEEYKKIVDQNLIEEHKELESYRITLCHSMGNHITELKREIKLLNDKLEAKS